MSIRHDWYQSDQKVVITVLIKNATERNCKIELSSENVLLTADDYILDLSLNQPINVEQSDYKISAVKVEITLAKIKGERWDTLTKAEIAKPESSKPINLYKKDWDSVAKEIDKEKDVIYAILKASEKYK